MSFHLIPNLRKFEKNLKRSDRAPLSSFDLIYYFAGLRSRSASAASFVNEDLDVGDEVTIGGRSPRQGIIRFKGSTKFAPGRF